MCFYCFYNMKVMFICNFRTTNYIYINKYAYINKILNYLTKISNEVGYLCVIFF